MKYTRETTPQGMERWGVPSRDPRNNGILNARVVIPPPYTDQHGRHPATVRIEGDDHTVEEARARAKNPREWYLPEEAEAHRNAILEAADHAEKSNRDYGITGHDVRRSVDARTRFNKMIEKGTSRSSSEDEDYSIHPGAGSGHPPSSKAHSYVVNNNTSAQIGTVYPHQGGYRAVGHVDADNDVELGHHATPEAAHSAIKNWDSGNTGGDSLTRKYRSRAQNLRSWSPRSN